MERFFQASAPHHENLRNSCQALQEKMKAIHQKEVLLVEVNNKQLILCQDRLIFIDTIERIDYTVNYEDWVLLQLYIYAKHDIADSLDLTEQEKSVSQAIPHIHTEAGTLLKIMAGAFM
jgi:hypothetical protein